MKKYIITSISLLLMIVSSLHLFAAEQQVVRVGAFNYYPAIFKDADGTVKGFYVDALADIAQRENIRFEYVYGSWNEGLERIKSGEVDVLTSVAFTPDRATFLDYAKTPLLTVWGELYVPLSSEIDGIRALNGKKIAVMKGDLNGRNFIELVKKFNITCEFIEMPGFDDVFKAVAAKNVDAGVVSSTFGVAKQKEYVLRSTGVVFNPFDIFFAAAKGKNNNLLLILDNYLESWNHQKDSPFNTARQKWSYGITGTENVIPQWLSVLVVGLALLALCASGFVAMLRRQVRSKTRSVIESSKRYQILTERQNALLAAVPDIIMEVDANRVYTWANRAGLEFFGQDVIGKEAAYYFDREQDTYEIVKPLFSGSEETVYVESWQRRKDGEVRLLAWWCRSFVGGNSEVSGTLSTARDITEDKYAEESKYRALFDQAAVGVAKINSMTGQFVTINQRYADIVGYTMTEMTSMTFRDITFPDDLSNDLGNMNALVEGRINSFSMEKRYIHKNGSIVWVLLTVTPTWKSGETPDYHIAVVQDITGRKQAEESLRETNDYLDNLFRYANAPIVVWDTSFRITRFNKAFETLTGWTFDEVTGKDISVLFPTDHIGRGMELIRNTVSGERLETVELSIRHVNGTVSIVLWNSATIFKQDGITPLATIAQGYDITKRKRAEEDLQEANKFLTLTQQSAGAGLWSWDFGTDQLNWSPEQYQIFGLEPVIGTPTFDLWRSVVHPDDLNVSEANIEKAIRDHNELFNDYRIIKPSGEIRWINAFGHTSYDDGGQPLRMSGICLDVTDRKQIENIQSNLLQLSNLHPSEDYFETLASYLANTLNMGYVCIDRLHGDNLAATTLAIYHDGKFEDNVTYTLKDTPCGDVVGKEICVFPSKVRDLFPHDEALQDLKAESYVGTTLWSFDMKPIGLIAVIGRNPLMNTRFSETVLKLVSDRAAVELERRQTEEEKHLLEQQFQHTQKLESLGVLAGGIAHDFNNILAIIIGYCGLTKMDYGKAEKNIPEIEKAAERAAALCRQMLAYAGKAQLSTTQVNMRMLVDEMVTMLHSTLPRNTAIKHGMLTDIPFIIADASQLRQVVMNLIINASEAIGTDQGEVIVSLEKITVKAGKSYADYYGKAIPPGEYVCLEVTDNGCGMDETTKWRIFEPFYTTKFTGRGLGMSAVLGIISSHYGALQLFSQPGQGTTFKVYLPIPISAAIREEHQVESAPPPPWQGSGTILLVEDEDQIRFLAKSLLEMFGFTVLEAENGRDALALYQQNAADVRLVLTDMGMPVMDGYALFHELKKLNLELPIIISSGFGDADVYSKIGSDNIAGLISKPYNPHQMREVLQSVVEKCDTTICDDGDYIRSLQ